MPCGRQVKCKQSLQLGVLSNFPLGFIPTIVGNRPSPVLDSARRSPSSIRPPDPLILSPPPSSVQSLLSTAESLRPPTLSPVTLLPPSLVHSPSSAVESLSPPTLSPRMFRRRYCRHRRRRTRRLAHQHCRPRGRHWRRTLHDCRYPSTVAGPAVFGVCAQFGIQSCPSQLRQPKRPLVREPARQLVQSETGSFA